MYLRGGGGDLRRKLGSLLSGMGGGSWKPRPELPSRDTGCTGAAMPCPFAPSPAPTYQGHTHSALAHEKTPLGVLHINTG